MNAWCRSHLLCSLWPSSRVPSLAISIFSWIQPSSCAGQEEGLSRFPQCRTAPPPSPPGCSRFSARAASFGAGEEGMENLCKRGLSVEGSRGELKLLPREWRLDGRVPRKPQQQHLDPSIQSQPPPIRTDARSPTHAPGHRVKPSYVAPALNTGR